jgi:hypothetical protein
MRLHQLLCHGVAACLLHPHALGCWINLAYTSSSSSNTGLLSCSTAKKYTPHECMGWLHAVRAAIGSAGKADLTMLYPVTQKRSGTRRYQCWPNTKQQQNSSSTRMPGLAVHRSLELQLSLWHIHQKLRDAQVLRQQMSSNTWFQFPMSSSADLHVDLVSVSVDCCKQRVPEARLGWTLTLATPLTAQHSSSSSMRIHGSTCLSWFMQLPACCSIDVAAAGWSSLTGYPWTLHWP